MLSKRERDLVEIVEQTPHDRYAVIFNGVFALRKIGEVVRTNDMEAIRDRVDEMLLVQRLQTARISRAKVGRHEFIICH